MPSASELVRAAIGAGFEQCAVIPLELMYGYEEKLAERIRLFPQTREKLEGFSAFARLREVYPWAKAIAVCSFRYGKYRIPERLNGRIAKYYLTDARRDAAAPGFRTSRLFEEYLLECGLQTATERDFGITALRWAAMQAGMGIIRKNNFFYTEKGSWQYLEAFLIDEPLERMAESNVRACPESCNLCMKACPTASLAAPYAMCRNTCVSCLTTWDGWDLSKEPLRDKLGQWIYGCDACQDACPFNKKAWSGEAEFPGLEELAGHLSNVEIVGAAYEWLSTVLQPKLWYIPPGKEWRFKTNALNAMLNNFSPEYLPAIRKACRDERAEVRSMAEWVLAEIARRPK